MSVKTSPRRAARKTAEQIARAGASPLPTRPTTRPAVAPSWIATSLADLIR